MKRVFGLLLVFATLTTYSQSDIDNILKGSAKDANYLVKGYAAPAMNTLGFGLNQGWYNTAANHKLGGFDLTITGSAVYFPSSDLTYRVENSQMQNLVLTKPAPVSGAGNVPSIFGSDSDSDRPVYQYKNPTTGVPIPGQTFTGPAGLGLKTFIPIPMVQLGIGLPLNSELKVRFFPSTKVGSDGTASLFGIGLVHDVKQYIPGLKKLPFDLSIFGGYTTMKTTVALDSNLPDNKATFETSATTVQALISKKFAVVTFYGGLGFNFTNTSLSVLGKYDTGTIDPVTLKPIYLIDPINFSLNPGGARFTAGMRLKLAFFTLHGDYTFQQYNAFTAGLGFSFR